MNKKNNFTTRLTIAIGLFAFVLVNPQTYTNQPQWVYLVNLLFYLTISICLFSTNIMLILFIVIGFNAYYSAFYGISWIGISLEIIVFYIGFWRIVSRK